MFEELQQKVNELFQHVQRVQPNRWEALAIINDYCKFLDSVLALGTHFQTWLESARAGETLQKQYQNIVEKIQSQKEDLQRRRQEYETLAEKEQEWQRLLEEHRRLEKELERLQSLESLIRDLNLEDLRQQVERLRERRELLEVGDLVAKLLQNAKEIILLAQEAISKLDSETQEILYNAEKMNKMVEEKAKELSRKRERYERARQEWEKLKVELEVLLEADQRVAEALPQEQEKVGDALEAIDKVKKLVQAIEESLRIAIDANEKEHRKEPIFLGGS